MSDHRQGVVTDPGPPLQVRFDGDSVDSQVLWLDGYYPLAGDRVILGRWGSTWVVLGKVA